MRAIATAGVVLAAGFWSAALSADTEAYSSLSERVRTIKQSLDMPAGAAVVLVDGSEVVYEGYFGFADIEARQPVDEDTHFYIASTTKAFFALAVLLAEHRGDLDEDSTLRELFPKTTFPFIDPAEVTVRQLMAHTSGVDSPAFTWAGSYSGQHDQALRERLVAALQPDARAVPGEHSYTNLGYNVMSVWFEQFYGRDWRVTLEETVLTPLRMGNTSGFMSDIPQHAWSFAQPYSFKHENGKERVYLMKDDSTMYSIGLISTARDVSRFLIAQLNEGVVDGRRVFPAEVIRKSHERQVDANSYYDGYAWGWQLGEFEGEEEIFHTGGFVGASALISFLPERNVGLIVLQNENGLRANTLAQIVKHLAYGPTLGVDAKATAGVVNGMVESLKSRAAKSLRDQALADAELTRTPWNLSRDRDRYAGSYTHELAGEIIVLGKGQHDLTMRWGNLRGDVFGHEERDHAVVRFRPGELTGVEFKTEGEGVRGLEINGFTFIKH